jgi:hypothetical protein
MNAFSPMLCLVALATGALQGGAVLAHEIESSRATLVLRDRQHLSMTVFVDFVGVLHQALAPKVSVRDFVLMHAAMKPEEFQSLLLRAQNKLEGNFVITLKSGKVARLTQWVWPDALAVQNQLQQRAMQAVVAPTEHSHVVPTEIRAEARSSSISDFSSITIKLPAEFRQVLVVSYQPTQTWVRPNEPSMPITFGVEHSKP